MPLCHSCRAVLRIPKRENRAAQYRAASHQQTADFRTDTIKKQPALRSPKCRLLLCRLPNPLQPAFHRFFHLVVEMAVEQAGQIVFLRRVVHQVRRFHHVARHGIHIAEIVD